MLNLSCHIYVIEHVINVGSQGDLMFKLISFFIFVAAFIWTWSLLTTKNTVGIDIHAGIQSKLAVLIEDVIKKKRPNSSNFQLNQIYTEKLEENKIKAHFSYNFSDLLEDNETTDQSISGDAILTRGLSEDPNVQKWVIHSVKTDSNSLEFKEGMIITSENKNPSEKNSIDSKNENSSEKQTH